MSYYDRMITVVGNLDFTGDPVDEFADGAFVLLAAALAKLPASEREIYLNKIECGDLRRAVAPFLDVRSPLPRTATNGNGHDH